MTTVNTFPSTPDLFWPMHISGTTSKGMNNEPTRSTPTKLIKRKMAFWAPALTVESYAKIETRNNNGFNMVNKSNHQERRMYLLLAT